MYRNQGTCNANIIPFLLVIVHVPGTGLWRTDLLKVPSGCGRTTAKFGTAVTATGSTSTLSLYSLPHTRATSTSPVSPRKYALIDALYAEPSRIALSSACHETGAYHSAPHMLCQRRT